jgi:hypothetical protein
MLSPRVAELADRLFDVVAGDGPRARPPLAEPPNPVDALEAMMLAACCFGRQAHATKDGMLRLFEALWPVVCEGLPDFKVELCDQRDLDALVDETARRRAVG